MLNSTLAAMTRVVCVILEQYQTDDGVLPWPLA
jgi:seryl-tRNA synthetase